MWPLESAFRILRCRGLFIKATFLVDQEPMCESSTVIYYESTNSPHTIHHLSLTPAVLQSGPAKFNHNIANTAYRNTTYCLCFCLIWGNWEYLLLARLHEAQGYG